MYASEFGVLLRRHRLAAGFSQGVLADLARMSVNGISALERGHRRSPQRETLALLADALKLGDEQRAAFVAAAARPKSPRAGEATVTTGPWPEHHATQLPAALSSFVGRENDLRDIAQLLRTYRLVTLTGAGGIGKTRTALHIAAQWIEQDDAAVRLVELAPLVTPSQVLPSIAAALGAQDVPERPMMETLVAYLGQKPMLVVLDNCEHLISEAARVSATILQRCRSVRILATSRERLRIGGERAYRLPSLDAPSAEAALNLPATAAIGVAAMALFVDRARAADNRFAMSDEDVRAIAEICRRVDGIPLAIELAAARAAVLSPAAIAEMLDRRFALLNAGSRTVLPRQQTMRATIDWSVALLSEAEAKILRRAAVFSGGWSLEAAEAVCCDEEIEPRAVAEHLASLAEKSLLTVRFAGEFPVFDRRGNIVGNRTARYTLLESIRDYALEELLAYDERERLARRHAEWAADYGEWLQEWSFYDSSGFYHASSLPDVFEMPNRQEALRWALSAEDALLAGRIAGTFPWFDVSPDIVELFATALARIEGSGHRLAEARILLAIGYGAFVGRRELGERSYETVQAAVTIFEQCGERNHWLAEAYSLVIDRAMQTGRFEEALRASDLQLELFQALGANDDANRAGWVSDRGLILEALRRYDEARACFKEAVDLVEFRTDELAWKSALAALEAETGNLRGAVVLAERAAAIVPRDEWPLLEGVERGVLATNRTKAVAHYLLLGELDAARRASLDAFDLASRRWAGISIATHLCLATIAALTGDIESGAALKGYVDANYAASGIVRSPNGERTYGFLVEALAGHQAATEITQASVRGAALNADLAADLAAAIATRLRSLG